MQKRNTPELRILEWIASHYNWQPAAASLGQQHLSKGVLRSGGKRKPITVFMIELRKSTGGFAGTVIAGQEKQSAERLARIVFASTLFGREIESYNDLSDTEVAIFMGLLLNAETKARITIDLRACYDYIMKNSGKMNRPSAREALVVRSGGICEAWYNHPQLNIDYRGQPLGEYPLEAKEMHEIVQRGAMPVEKQDILWYPGNTLFLSPWFHQHARYAIHKIGWGEWAMDLLFLVRTLDEIAEFVGVYKKLVRHREPAIVEMERRLNSNK